MKKVLLIGELNQTLSSVNKHMSTRYQTQICEDVLELVAEKIKVFPPDMVAVCLSGRGKLDPQILNLFSGQYSETPVLLIGTEEECRCYHQYYEKEQFDFVIRPTTLLALMRKCAAMLRTAGAEPTEKEKVKTHTDEKNDGGNGYREIGDHRKKKILAVDDSGILLRSVKAMLDGQYEMKLATSGMMAIKMARKETPDVILLDYEMPDFDGKQTLEEIRKDEQLSEIPVVFLTGVADKAHIAAVLGLKPAGYLLKPIDWQKLIDTIEKVLSGTK